MIRTSQYRIYSLLNLGAILIGLAALVYFFLDDLVVLATTTVTVLIVSRAPNYFWSSYFAGQKLQRQGNYLEALVRYERFARELKQNDNLKPLFWLLFAPKIYTHDIEVINLVNVGVCYLMINRPDRAIEALDLARQKDEESPLPYFNLALVYAHKGNRAEMEKHLEPAERLGYPVKKCADLRAAFEEDAAEAAANPATAKPRPQKKKAD